MNRLAGILCFAACCSGAAVAGSGGSAYSIFGIGDLRSVSSMSNIGMGGAGIGLPSTLSISAVSPAAWARINRVRLEAGMLYEGFHSSDGSRSIYRAAGTFDGALLAVPISPDNGIVFAGGFLPYSTVSYNTYTRGSGADIDYVINHQGSGGLGRGLAGLSWAPLPWLSLGTSLDYYFGSVDKRRTLTASSTSALSAAGGTITESITSHGLGMTASVLIQGFERISESLRPLSFGFTAGSRTKLKTISQFRYTYATESDSSAEQKGAIVLPLTFGAGLGYQIDGRYDVAADVTTQLWSRAEFDGAASADLRNATRFSVGGERAGSRDPLAHWLDKVAYRLGFAYTATYYRPDGDPVNEWGVSAGAGIPFSGDARMNLALEYAHRAGTDRSPITDNILRVVLSINISEEWFVRPEEE
jgi:hypothetical protein